MIRSNIYRSVVIFTTKSYIYYIIYTKKKIKKGFKASVKVLTLIEYLWKAKLTSG